MGLEPPIGGPSPGPRAQTITTLNVHGGKFVWADDNTAAPTYVSVNEIRDLEGLAALPLAPAQWIKGPPDETKGDDGPLILESAKTWWRELDKIPLWFLAAWIALKITEVI